MAAAVSVACTVAVDTVSTVGVAGTGVAVAVDTWAAATVVCLVANGTGEGIVCVALQDRATTMITANMAVIMG